MLLVSGQHLAAAADNGSGLSPPSVPSLNPLSPPPGR